MIDIDKDYLITVNLKNTKIKSDKTLFFYNTDLNICNIFIQLVCTDSDKTIPDDLIVEFAVLKPETNEFKTLDATLISKEDLLYQVDLTTDYLDIIGTYECEIRVSGTIDNETKCFTSKSFDYVVRPNITAKLSNQIKQDKNLPILEKLIKEVNDIALGIEMNQVQLKKDDNLVGDNKTIVGAINQLREDINSGGKVELKDYQKKTDNNLATENKTIVGAVNEVNSQCKDIANIGTKEKLSGKFKSSTLEDILLEIYNKIYRQIANPLSIQINGLIPEINFVADDWSSMTKENKIVAQSTINFNGLSWQGYAELKWQGNSSLAYPKKNLTAKFFEDENKTKKQKFNIKLDNNHKEWGNENKFVFKANYIDHSHARNIVSARIWSKMVSSRNNYNSLPQLFRESPNNGVIDGFPIKVTVNGVYQGLYTWNIPKDAWTFNMDATLDTHCILCSENYDSGCFRSVAKIDGTDWSNELSDATSNVVMQSFNNAIDLVINGTNSEFRTGLSNYFDVDSLIDYYIFACISCGLDSMGKNQLYVTYDAEKWIASMYDMDSTWGLYWDGSKFVSSEYRMQEDYESGLNTSDKKGNLLYRKLEEVFGREIKARYNILKDTVLSQSNIITEFENFINVYTDELLAKDLEPYPNIPLSNINHLTQIKQFVQERIVYTNEKINNLTDYNEDIISVTSLSLDKESIKLTLPTYNVNLVSNYTNFRKNANIMPLNKATNECPAGSYITSTTNGCNPDCMVSDYIFLSKGNYIVKCDSVTGFYVYDSSKVYASNISTSSKGIRISLNSDSYVRFSVYPVSDITVLPIYIYKEEKYVQDEFEFFAGKMDSYGNIITGNNNISTLREVNYPNTITYSNANWMSVHSYDKNLKYLGGSRETQNGEGSYALPENTCFVRFSYNGSTTPIITFANNIVKTETNKDVINTNSISATLIPTNASNKKVTWSANNANVELVSNGLDCTIKAKAVGSSVITCTSQDTSNGTISDTCNVTIS